MVVACERHGHNQPPFGGVKSKRRTGEYSSVSAEPPCVARWSIAAAFQQASDHSAPSSTHHGTFLIEPPGPVGNDICARSFRESGWQLEWGRSHVGRREAGPWQGIFVSNVWIRAEACSFWFPCCAVLSAANLHGRNCRRVHSRCPPSAQLREVFRDVQLQHIFHDSKTFADLHFSEFPSTVRADYQAHKHDVDFDLSKFVQEHFSVPKEGPTVGQS